MKIAIATVQVPFITGGAEIHAGMLKDELVKRGHEADIITIPFKWYPPQCILDCILMSRLVDLTEVNGQKIDMVISMKFPAYYIQHNNKVIWMLHQHRQAYELWGTEHGDLHNMAHGEEVRQIIKRCDDKFIPEAKKIFTNSATVAERLMKYNRIKAMPLYHPPKNVSKFKSVSYDDYIFYPSRINTIKRQALLVQAARYLKSPVKIVLAGNYDPREMEVIKKIISKDGTGDRIDIMGFITDDEKIDLYSRCLGVYFGPYQEDYGYVTLEAFFSSKPVITHNDSGGPLEFVNDSNGFVLEPDPAQIATAIDSLYYDKEKAKKLGTNGRGLMDKLNIGWDHVIDSLLK